MKRLVALAAVALLTQGPVSAQVTAERNLVFGVVTSGTTTSVAKTSASAGRWRVHGILGIGSQIKFTLPTSLAGSGAPMPISFSATDGVYRVNNTNPSGGTTFNPNGTLTIPVSLISDIYLWLGGSVSPALNQAPGNYTGSVVVTVTGLL